MTMQVTDLNDLQIGQLILIPNRVGDKMIPGRVGMIYDPDNPPIWVQPDYLIYAGPDDRSYSDYYALDEILGGICEHCGGNLVVGKHSVTVDGYCDDGSNDEIPF